MTTLFKQLEVVNLISGSHDSDVHLVTHKETGTLYLLKTLKFKEGSAATERKLRFHREVEIVSSFEHSNIAKPAHTYTDDLTYSILYPFRKGKTLAKILSDSVSISSVDALSYCKQLLDALKYVHGRGYIHCDINPHNIFINDERGVELLDFGLSMTEEEIRNVTEGKIIGTVPYLSPEQLGFTDFKIDTRSDLFCVGIILYRILSGKMPYQTKDNTIEELLTLTLKTEVQPVKNIPSYLNTILLKSLKATPEDRYQTATGFKYDIDQAIQGIKEEGCKSFVPGQMDAIIAVQRSQIFVAREIEIATLEKGYQQLLSDSGSAYLLCGISGVGKTEIVRNFRKSVDARKTPFLSAKCNRFSANQPYSVLRAIVIHLIVQVEKLNKTDSDAFKKKLSEGLGEYSGILCSIIPELKSYFIHVNEVGAVEKEKETDRAIHVLTCFFDVLSTLKPVVLFVDDIQWIDQISFSVVKNIISNNSRMLVLLNFRTEKTDGDLFLFGQDLKKLAFKKILNVNSFSRSEIKDLLSLKIGKIYNVDYLADVLLQKSDSNPFTIVEAAGYLVNSGILKQMRSGWEFSLTDITSLPDKFDPVSLVLAKLKKLTEKENKYLLTASLIQGKIDQAILDEVCGEDTCASKTMIDNLESLGFILRRPENSFVFTHDKIQDSLALKLSKDETFRLNERIAVVYQNRISQQREYVFNAAEYYLKSKNIIAASKICYEAATHAVKQNAFDIATRHFKNITLMSAQWPALGIASPVDMIKVNMAYGNVLMLTGRNQQALNVLKKILQDSHLLSKDQVLEIKYAIGSIYHNMGEFKSSILYLKESLKELNVKLPSGKLGILFGVIREIGIQVLFSLGVKHLFPIKHSVKTSLKIRALNKLSYSLFFSDMIATIHVHFKSLNTADRLNDCFEKGETYTFHVVPIFQMMLKKRAFSYFKKALDISKRIKRNDLSAFAKNFGGIAYFCNAQWKIASELFNQSSADYKAVGDLWGQATPVEHLAYIEYLKGDLRKALAYSEALEKISVSCSDLRAEVVAKRMINLIHLAYDVYDKDEWERLQEAQAQIKNAAVTVTVQISCALLQIQLGDLCKAYEISLSALTSIKLRNLNYEYVASAYSTHCEILIAEYRNRLSGKFQLSLTDKQLKRELNVNVKKAIVQGILYPAHQGAAMCAYAWFHAMHKRNRVASILFKQSIKKHHVLDMKYEEAKSLRDFGLFLDDCSLPGIARDNYTEAYKLFDSCGAVLETNRLRHVVDSSVLAGQHAAEEKERVTEPLETSTSTSDVNYLRIDTIYEASTMMHETDDIDLLLKQILLAMIKTSGAQYGYVLLKDSRENGHIQKKFALSFDGTVIDNADIHYSEKIIAEVKQTNKIVLVKNLPKELSNYENSLDLGLPGEPEPSSEQRRSVLCVPLSHGEEYLGFVYLANDMVSGLFAESAKKAVQILSVQANILLRDAYLMESFKILNKNLVKKVKEQTNDIQEKNKQLEEYNIKVVESERMKGLLAGTLVHDIKNYAAGIEGNVSLLQRVMPDEPRIKKTARIVSDCCLGIASLASNLLDIGKMEEGKLVMRKETMTGQLLFAMAEQLRQNIMFEEKNISVICTDTIHQQFEIMADYYLVERVMQNLFSNAAKYVPKDGTVILSLEGNHDENILCFYNSGIPIPDTDKAALFDKYARLESKSSQYSKGLGLFFCKMVMNAHNGRIWLDTNETGNFFRLAFPRKPATQLSPAA